MSSEDPKKKPKRKRSKLTGGTEDPTDTTHDGNTKRKKKAREDTISFPADADNAPEKPIAGSREAKKLAKEERMRRKMEVADVAEENDDRPVEVVAGDVEGVEGGESKDTVEKKKKKKKSKKKGKEVATSLEIPQPADDEKLSEQGKKGVFASYAYKKSQSSMASS
jgi:hypothetical protein